jgi:hypothetical protein
MRRAFCCRWSPAGNSPARIHTPTITPNRRQVASIDRLLFTNLFATCHASRVAIKSYLQSDEKVLETITERATLIPGERIGALTFDARDDDLGWRRSAIRKMHDQHKASR